jgi:uncharacterized Tic20 family protein
VLMIVLIGFVTLFVVWVLALVFGIIGGMAANRGEWYKYPFSVPVVS